jgi:hypothetical protein
MVATTKGLGLHILCLNLCTTKTGKYHLSPAAQQYSRCYGRMVLSVRCAKETKEILTGSSCSFGRQRGKGPRSLDAVILSAGMKHKPLKGDGQMLWS